MDSPSFNDRWMSSNSPWRWVLRFLMILGIGGFLVLVYPISFPSWLAQSDLEIFTTASQNPSSSGTELRLLAVTRSDGKLIDLSTLKSSNLWKLDRAQRLSANKKPYSKLSLEENAAVGYRLEFLGGPQAGIVLIRWRGQVQILDLYQPVEKVVEITLPQNRRLRLLQILYLITCALVIGLGLFVLTLFLVSRRWERSKSPNPPTRWVILGYALPSIGVWSLYLLAFWPGIMSYDSLLQWREMTTGKFTEISPAFHTLTNWLLTRIWHSPAAIALFQILSLSLVVGWALYLFRKAGVPKWACGLSATLIALSPVCAATSITLWKDNFYATAMLVFSLILFQVSITEGKWLEKIVVWIALGLSGALAALYRHNGWPVVIGTLAVLPFIYPKVWRFALYSTLVFLGLFMLVRSPLYSRLEVDQSYRGWLYGIRLLHYLAAYSQSSAAIPPEQLSALQSLWPGDEPLPYDCHFIDTTHFTIPPRSIIEQLPALEEMLYLQIRRAPRIALDHWLCANDLVWRISKPPHGYLSTYDFSNYWDRTEYVVGASVAPIPIQSKLPRLNRILAQYLFATNTWLFWRPALYLYLALYCGLIFALRRGNWRDYLFLIPLLLHTSVLLLVNASQEARFQYYAYILSLLSISLIFIPHSSKKPISQSTDKNPQEFPP